MGRWGLLQQVVMAVSAIALTSCAPNSPAGLLLSAVASPNASVPIPSNGTQRPFHQSGQLAANAPRMVQIQQAWQLEPDSTVAGYSVAAGLGDISIALKSNSVYAPFNGRVQPNTHTCVLFSSPEVPAYLFRLCGLNQPTLGKVRSGRSIGTGDYVHIATLRKQDGTWVIVEPSTDILQRILQPQ